jgi:hypothetical protein
MQALNGAVAAAVVEADDDPPAGGALDVLLLFALLPHAASTRTAAQATVAIFIPREARKTHLPLVEPLEDTVAARCERRAQPPSFLLIALR